MPLIRTIFALSVNGPISRSTVGIREFVTRGIKPEFVQLIEAEIDHLLREKEVEKWTAVGSA
jgi:hypothetical protein